MEEKQYKNRHLKYLKSDNWSTPKQLYEELKKEFNLTFDPCPLNTDLKNALFENWNGNIFCNPPYSNIDNFINKGLLELKKGNANICVFLLPVSTDTKWFHKYIYYNKNAKIRFIKGRLKFGNGKNPAPFPSMVVIFENENH